MISRWHDEAALELRAEFQWLEGQSSGLGNRFLEAVRSALRTIEEFPDLGAPRNRGTRRLLLAKFPFDLVYLVESDAIIVLALAHHRRRPGYWRSRAAAGL